MDFDNLQKWIEELYYKVKEHKERSEYQAHLLDELVQPWPLECTPQSVQEAYKCKLENEREQEEEIKNVSEFDQEIKSVENILQKARLLHEKGTKAKKIVENGTRFSETNTKNEPIITSVNQKNPQKFALKSASNRNQPKKSLTSAQKAQNVRINQAPFKTNTNPLSAKHVRSQIGSAQSRTTQAKSNAKVKTTVAPVPSTKSVESTPKITPKEDANLQNAENSSILANAKDTVMPVTALKSTDKKKIDIDISKLDIKLKYSEIANDLDLPIKAKKLLATHAKLRDENCNALEAIDCKEENSFIKNMASSPNAFPSEGKPIKTLRATNLHLEDCIRVCTNVISVLKYQSRGEPHYRSSKLRWSAQQDSYLKSETLKVVDEICSYLWLKHKYFKNIEIVKYDHEECKNFDQNLLSSFRLGDLNGIHDDSTYPATSLTYNSTREIIKWKCEQLKHQYFIIERNLIQNMSKDYFDVLQKLISSNNGDSPSPELGNLLQNAYGLLAEDDILLPAYVIAE